jgi:aminoglycoside phosphotransferase
VQRHNKSSNPEDCSLAAFTVGAQWQLSGGEWTVGYLVPKQYRGHLPARDPLHPFLQHHILPRLGVAPARVDFRVFSLKGSKVYLYEEKYSQTQLVGKFFVNGGSHNEYATEHMQREFSNLQLLRGYGLDGYPHHVVEPLGVNASLNSILVEEHCGGVSLSNLIYAAIHQRQEKSLYAKLTALAYFLATLHNRTANGQWVNFAEDCGYFDRMVEKLRSNQTIGAWDADELYWLRDRWREQPRMWEDQQVLVHGDATPSNFLFGDNVNVTAIDLERMKRADRVFDLGRISGELQHFYLQATGNRYAAEPFIGHFLWEYACHFPDRDRAFCSITGRIAFQMGLTLLRIARNSWINEGQRQRLVGEAKIILRTF